jgi:DNA-binding beta-propeller fold protein YncE
MRVPRWVGLVLVVAVVVAAVDLGVFLLARDTPDAAAAAKDHVAVIDPAKGRIVAQVSVGHAPTAVVTGYGGAWVLNRGDGTVSHIDGRTRKVVGTIEPDAVANDLTAGAGGIWFAGRPRRADQPPLDVAELEHIDPATDRVDRELETHTGATVIAAGGDALWSTGYLGGYVRGSARSDPLTGAMRKVDTGIYGDLVAADDSAVYWVASAGNRVARVSTSTAQMTASRPLLSDAAVASGMVPANATAVAVGGGSVWISMTDGSVRRIDARLRREPATIPVCRNALSLAYGEGAVWVACSDGVVRLDPASGSAVKRIALASFPRGIAAGEGSVWVTLD